jgi:hypothetical protein
MRRKANLGKTEYIRDVRVSCEMQKCPGTSCRASVLASHEQSNHDMGDFVILEKTAIPISLVQERCKHVLLVLLIVKFAQIDSNGEDDE